MANNLITFTEKDFPNGASHCPQHECGFAIHRGVLIQWDEDHDHRVVLFIDELTDQERNCLVIVQEHEGQLSLVWDSLPEELFTDVTVDGDTWIVNHSVVGIRS
jgi:hypothetical protein